MTALVSYPSGAELVHPCGHSSDYCEAVLSPDEFACPVCRLWWKVEQSSPTRYPSGFIMPGNRSLKILGTLADRVAIQASASRPVQRRFLKATATLNRGRK